MTYDNCAPVAPARFFAGVLFTRGRAALSQSGPWHGGNKVASAAFASRMPVPIGSFDGIATGKRRAVAFNIVSICAGVSGLLALLCTSAATAATCGAAIEVPDMPPYAGLPSSGAVAL